MGNGYNIKQYNRNYQRLRYKNDKEYREKIKKQALERRERLIKKWKAERKCSTCGREIKKKTKKLKDGRIKHFKTCQECRTKFKKWLK